MTPKTVIASACCCGITCRWHGRKSYKTSAIRDLEAKGIRVIPVCPEMLGGLPCPRPPVRTIRGRVFQTDDSREKLGREVTALFERGACEALRIALTHGAREAYLFKLSPSCAIGGIAGKILQGAGIRVIPIW